MERIEEQEKERKNQEICRKLVEREVVHCCSSMVSDLLKTPDLKGEYKYDDLLELCIGYDYESAAYDEGWRERGKDDPVEDDVFFVQLDESIVTDTSDAANWQELCDKQSIEPYNREVFEHWIVSSWFAEKLQEHGEIVGELFDFWIWGRCTTGQAICIDSVIRQIAEEMEILVGQKNDWSK